MLCRERPPRGLWLRNRSQSSRQNPRPPRNQPKSRRCNRQCQARSLKHPPKRLKRPITGRRSRLHRSRPAELAMLQSRVNRLIRQKRPNQLHPTATQIILMRTTIQINKIPPINGCSIPVQRKYIILNAEMCPKLLKKIMQHQILVKAI